MIKQGNRVGGVARNGIYTACSAIALVAGMTAFAPEAAAQQVTPGDANCPIVGGIATCSGNLADGVSYQITDPDNGAGTIVVENPTGPIAPNGTYGIGIDRGDRDMTLIVRDGVIINTIDNQGIVEPAQGIIGIVRNGFDLTIDSGATINANGTTQPIAGLEGVVFGGNAQLGIVNRGDITVTADNHISVGIAANNNNSTGAITITNSGDLNVSSTAGGERDFVTGGILATSAAGSTVNVTNTGDITVTTAASSFDTNFAGEAAGIITNALADTSVTTITNSGVLTGRGPNAGGIVGFTRNNNAAAPSSVVINNTGAISTDSFDTYGILAQSAGVNANLTVDNDAAITMTNGANSNGIMALVQSQRGVITVDNSAAISGSGPNYMRGAGISTSGAPANGTYTLNLNNTGDITFDTPYAQGLTMFATHGDNVTGTVTNTGDINLANTTAEFSVGIRAVVNGTAAGETATGTQMLTVNNSGDITMGAGNAMMLGGTTVNARNSGSLSNTGGLSLVDITANAGTFELVQDAGQPAPTLTAGGPANSAITVRGSGSQQYRVLIGEGVTVQANGTGIAMGHTGGMHIEVDGTLSGGVAAVQEINAAAGDDTLINRGTINGVVFMGDGNDTLTTLAGSLITGDINMGDGDDVVTLADNSHVGFVYLGAGNDLINIKGLSDLANVDGGAGTDTARMTFGPGTNVNGGSANMTGMTFTGFEIIQQNGSGNYILMGENAAALRYELNGGTLDQTAALANFDFVTAAGTQLNLNGSMRSLNHSGRLTMSGAQPQTVNMTGNVVFNAGSVYDVRIAPGGVSDRIATTGTATINGGTVNALVGAGEYVGGDSFTILSAQGGVTGQFAGLTQVSTAFLDISLSYLPNAVLIQLAPNRVDFDDFDLTFNQSQAAIPLNQFSTNVGTDTRTVVSEMLFLSTAEVAPALDAMSGELHASVLAAGLRSGRTLMTAAEQRNGAGSGLQFWGTVGANDNSIDGDGNASGVSSTAYSGVVGLDWNAGGGTWWAGALLGVSNGETEIFSGADSADIDTTVFGAYAGVGTMAQGLSARVNYAWATGDVDTTRTIAFGGLNRTASAAYDIDTVAAGLEVRYGIMEEAHGFAYGPAFAVDYANVERGAFAESGADSLNLSGDDDALSRFNYGLGGFVNWQGQGMTFDASLLYDRRVGDYTETRLRMAGLPGQSFAVRSPETEDSGLRLSARGEYALGGGWTVGAGYQGWLGGGDDSHAGVVTLTLR